MSRKAFALERLKSVIATNVIQTLEKGEPIAAKGFGFLFGEERSCSIRLKWNPQYLCLAWLPTVLPASWPNLSWSSNNTTLFICGLPPFPQFLRIYCATVYSSVGLRIAVNVSDGICRAHKSRRFKNKSVALRFPETPWHEIGIQEFEK